MECIKEGRQHVRPSPTQEETGQTINSEDTRTIHTTELNMRNLRNINNNFTRRKGTLEISGM